MRFIQCAVVRGYKLMKSYIADGKVSGAVTGQMVRHGTRLLCLAACLEAGGPKGRTVAGEHAFTIPEIYSCLDGQLAPFDYGIRARIAMHHEEGCGDNASHWRLHWTQFIFRGEETVEGAVARKIKTFGCNHQHIYPGDRLPHEGEE